MRTDARSRTHLVHIRGEGLPRVGPLRALRTKAAAPPQPRQSVLGSCWQAVGIMWAHFCSSGEVHVLKRGSLNPCLHAVGGSFSPAAARFALHFLTSLRDGVLYWHARYELAKGPGLCLTARFVPDFPRRPRRRPRTIPPACTCMRVASVSSTSTPSLSSQVPAGAPARRSIRLFRGHAGPSSPHHSTS